MKWVLNFLRTDCSAVSAIALALIVGPCCFGGGEAAAAVKLCKAVVTSLPHTAASEVDARRLALADWMRRSVDKGIDYPAWRIATPRTMRCTYEDEGYTCVARAAPCTISQTVPKPKKRFESERDGDA